MRKFLIITFILFSISSYCQSWTPIAGKQRFTNGVGLPTKDTLLGDISDSSQLILRRADSSLWFKYKTKWQKIGSSTIDTTNIAYKNKTNIFLSCFIFD